MIKICNFKYFNISTPIGYNCQDCGVFGVRLYREYNTFMEHQHLRCRACAVKKQSKNDRKSDDLFSSEKEHSIGWLVAAVPTEDGESFWGFTSVPDDGVKWWDNLPKELIKTEV
jgi:hypothetical protein